MNTKQSNAIHITYEMLADLLGLKDQHSIIGVVSSAEDVVLSKCSIIVTGPDCDYHLANIYPPSIYPEDASWWLKSPSHD